MTQQLDASRGEAAALRTEVGELKCRLEESRQQLSSNEQMIRWLNQQVGGGRGRGTLCPRGAMR